MTLARVVQTVEYKLATSSEIFFFMIRFLRDFQLKTAYCAVFKRKYIRTLLLYDSGTKNESNYPVYRFHSLYSGKLDVFTSALSNYVRIVSTPSSNNRLVTNVARLSVRTKHYVSPYYMQ